MKARVLHIVADGKPGGGTTLVVEMLRSLQRDPDFSPALLTQEGSYALRSAQRMGVRAAGIHFFSSRFDLRIARRIGEKMEKMEPDILHVHGGRAAFFTSFLSYFPKIYTVHGLHGLYRRSTPFRSISKRAEKRAMREFDAVVFVSRAERELARSEGLLPGKGRYIPNGIPFAALPTPRPAWRRLGFVGRLTEQKDPLLLLEIMQILGKEGFTLHVIGGGDLEAAFTKKMRQLRLEGVVEVTGELPRKEALVALSRIEVLLLPSRWEAFGLAAVEAMAMGIPVVAARLPALEEVVEEGESALFVDGRDPRDYSRAVLDLYASPDRRAQMAVGRGSKFGWERYIERYRSLYRELLGDCANR